MLSVALAIIIAVVAYWLIVQRPQQQQQAEHQQLVHDIGVGDHVMTVGGIFGTVLEIDGQTAVLQVGPTQVMRVATDGISRRVAEVPLPEIPGNPQTEGSMMHHHQNQPTPPGAASHAQPVPVPAPQPGATTPPAITPAPAGGQPGHAWIRLQGPSGGQAARLPAPPRIDAAAARAATGPIQLPRFAPSFGAAPIETHQQPMEPAPATTPTHVPVAGPMAPVVSHQPAAPAHHTPPSRQAEPEPVATPTSEGAPTSRRSPAPDGFLATARPGDPHYDIAREQAAAERIELARAWEGAVADFLASQGRGGTVGASHDLVPHDQPGHAGPPPPATFDGELAAVYPEPAAIPRAGAGGAGSDGDDPFAAARPFLRTGHLTGGARTG